MDLKNKPNSFHEQYSPSIIFTIYLPVGIPIARRTQRAAERPHAGDPDPHDRGGALQHGSPVLQQAGQVRHEDGRVGGRELGDIFQVK